MAGETTATSKAASTVPCLHGVSAGQLVAVTVTYAISTAELQLADIIQMVRVPKGATVYDVILVADDLDSNGSPAILLDVGDGDDDNYYIAASNIAQAGGIARANVKTAMPKTYTADDTIDLKINTAAATAQAGNVALTVFYTTA